MINILYILNILIIILYYVVLFRAKQLPNKLCHKITTMVISTCVKWELMW